MTAIPRPEPTLLAYFDPRRRAGSPIAFAHSQAKGPTLMFLPGYASDMDGTKASEIDVFAAAAGLAYLSVRLFGHRSVRRRVRGRDARPLAGGSDGGDRPAGRGPVLLIGSSMGGWLALHAALKRPDRVAGIVGIAAAPDFTDWGIKPEERESLLATGKLVRRPGHDGGPPQVTHARFVGSGAAMRCCTSRSCCNARCG